jgi:shikimate dehydrogenase
MTKIDAKTLVCATLARPNRRTSAPIMHNAAFDHLGLNYCYVAFEPADIGKAMDAVRALELVGVSVSRPYKEKVIQYLDQVDSLAARIGAVNCVHNDSGSLIGYNSDWVGARDALKEVTDLRRGQRIAILGAGGAARAVAFGLVEEGCDVALFNRTTDKGAAVAQEVGAQFGGRLEAVGHWGPDVIVNATSLGHGPREDVPVPEEALQSLEALMDIVVRADVSPLRARAEAHGIKTIGGSRMLVLQGAFTFKVFTGHDAPIEVMQAAVDRTLTLS